MNRYDNSVSYSQQHIRLLLANIKKVVDYSNSSKIAETSSSKLPLYGECGMFN